VRARGSWLVASVASIVAAVGCSAGVSQKPVGPGSGGSTGSGGRGGIVITVDAGPMQPEPCVGLCTDFPKAPIFDVGVSSDVAGRFGTPSGAPAPCVTEPEDGALFPNNWLRPRIRVPGSTDVLKITVQAPNQANDLVAYTNGESWALPKDVWWKLAHHVVEQDITVTVETPAGGATSVKFQIAPVGAGGSMVFWAANPAAARKMNVETMPQDALVEDSMLMGFTVGDETAVPTLKINQVKQPVTLQDGRTQGSHCIGCHTATPDGDYVAFVDAWPWSAAFAGVKPGIVGEALPGFAGGPCKDWNTCDQPKTFMQYPWNGPMTFSPAHWSLDNSGERIAIVATQVQDIKMPWGPPVGPNWQPGRLAWVDIRSRATMMTGRQMDPQQGIAFDYLATKGDPNPAAAFPTWSHDGNTIVYVSVSCPDPGHMDGCGTLDGRLAKGAADLYEVPYNNKAGGTATPVPGASTPENEEYYPALSSDDRLLAFTRVKLGQVMYANKTAEMYVVPRRPDATAKRLVANDPPVCTGRKSPGVNNHWPKWSPNSATVGNRTYYWLIFSSNRYGLPSVTPSNGETVEVSQLYITAVVLDETDTTKIETRSAIYLWNQPQDRLNTLPAWDNFNIVVE
jgi:hypothetical protein